MRHRLDGGPTDARFAPVCRIINGDLMLNASGIALITGVPADQITDTVGDAAAVLGELFPRDLPHEWQEAGQRRLDEAATHTGSEELVLNLEWLAAREGFQATGVVDDDGFGLDLIDPEPGAQ
ncbi:hypothetical protein [Williamsia sterculiae]|uniref:Uncharacterized protein n=1 Tax=Williamsia sterculiae TaxID=1344003 RepID=A0A1N7HBP0_9NOCA|nr:hypothetical protein [Williamsia sterculiae]SIS22232.1 hypothetical protein SAMN05445060_3929 [Williamsia sterculiae]